MNDQHPNDNTKWRVESSGPGVATTAYFDTRDDAEDYIDYFLDNHPFKLYRIVDTLVEYEN